MTTEPVLPDQERAETSRAALAVLGYPAGPIPGTATRQPPGQIPPMPPTPLTPPTPTVSPSGRASGIWHPRLPGRKPKLVRGAGLTVHGQIEDWLADAIATGRLAPSDRLPTEQDLAEWLGVSRMKLRHALAELAQRRLVTRSVGRSGGAVVAQPEVEEDPTVVAGFSEQLRRHGLLAGAPGL